MVNEAAGAVPVLTSLVRCPECGHAWPELIPVDTRVQTYNCRACRATLKPRAGDCCVLCSYGSVPCPAARSGRKPRGGLASEAGRVICEVCRREVEGRATEERRARGAGTFTHYCVHNDSLLEVRYGTTGGDGVSYTEYLQQPMKKPAKS